MPEYEFRVLCFNSGDACEFVKKQMSDFTIHSNYDVPGYDHSGTRKFDSDEKAQERKKRILQECGDKVLKVEIYGKI